jgi:hypothetical protein
MDQEKHQQQPHQQPQGGGGGGGEAEKPSNVSLPAMFLPVQGVPWWGPGFNPGGSVRPFAVMPPQPVPQQGRCNAMHACMNSYVHIFSVSVSYAWIVLDVCICICM